MPIAKVKASNTTDVMKLDEGNDSLDTFIRQAIGKEPFVSFSRPDLPGWPLLTPLKVQMQKCDKCAREFCSSINYRRHIRVHHRLKKRDKDSAKNRELLGAFWDKLSEDETKEILSFKDVSLEDVPGSSFIKSLTTLVRKPGFSSLPQYCMRAGSALLDIIQGRPSRFPLSSEELFGILDDASEKTFLCGAADSMQKFIFNGQAAKIGLETKNLVACTSFLVEQKLVKAWLACKNVEALRCEKLLVEEEEAAQRRQAELLERKRKKKLRQKEQKAKEQRQVENAGIEERIDDTQEAQPPAEQPCPLATSDLDAHGPQTMSDHNPSSLEPSQLPKTDEDVDLEIQMGSEGGCTDLASSHSIEQRMILGNSHKHLAVGRWHGSSKSQWNHQPNGFHANQNGQAPKLSSTKKHGSHRDLKPMPMINGNRKWSQKPKPEYSGENLKARVQKEATSQPNHNENHEVLIGSISVTLGNCSLKEGNNLDGHCRDCLAEHRMPKKNNVQDKQNRPDSAQGGTNRSTLKFWRPINRNGVKGQILIENGTRESQLDEIDTEGEERALSCNGCLRSCAMDGNNDGTGNCSQREDGTFPGRFQFSIEEAKAFLSERWKEAISTEHVKLVVSPDYEPSGRTEVQSGSYPAADQSLEIKKCGVLGNADNQLVNESSTVAGKAKFGTKPEKGVKLKYIPKQKAVT